MDDERRAQIRAEREELLVTRLDENLMSRAANIGENFTVDDLHELGRYIDMHGYLTEEHSFEESEVERLLRFENPLEVAVECVNLGGDIRSVDLNFYLSRMDAEDIYPMLPDGDTSPQEQETDTKKNPARNRPVRKGTER